MAAKIPSVGELWNISTNLTLVKWRHAVNNETELSSALDATDVHMLEADVSSNSTDAIMAHSSNDQSNLTLMKFLETVINKKSRKGIKLDFKTMEAFEKSKDILEKNLNEINFPMWLNADVIQGPDGAQSSFDAIQFMNNAAKVCPGCTLSLGWTTKAGSLDGSSNMNSYTKENIESMLNKVKQFNHTVTITYAVRAGLITNTNIDNLKLLISNTYATLTVWSAQNDHVDDKKLSKMISDIGLNKVYVDVPETLEKKLVLNGPGNIRPVTIGIMGSVLMSFLVSCLIFK